MVARLILFLVGYTMLFSVPVVALGYIYRRRLSEAWERRQKRLQGLRNDRLLRACLREGVCWECLEMTDPAVDCYDEKNGWYHAKCLKALLG